MRLLLVAAATLVSCGSSNTSLGQGGSTGAVTTSSVVSPTGRAEVGTATAWPATTDAPGHATTAHTDSTAEVIPTTMVLPPLPVDGTGVRGRVTAGPTCPVERPDQPCPPKPVRGRVDALDSAGHTAANADTDDAGRYAISLPSGHYELRMVTDGPFPRCPDTPVTVTAGLPVTADIDCDTGIR